ncbi:MAG: hypothetical protein AAGM84_07760, partial [Pseudomonadota bacterium]
MGYPTKITTCCYCGTRAALVLDKSRHELTCSSCGAPLHDLKRLPKDREGDRELIRQSKVRGPKPAKPKKKKKSKRAWRLKDVFEEALDL